MWRSSRDTIDLLLGAGRLRGTLFGFGLAFVPRLEQPNSLSGSRPAGDFQHLLRETFYCRVHDRGGSIYNLGLRLDLDGQQG